MAGKGAKYMRNRMVAKPVTGNRQPCVFCQQDVDDEVIYGKLYALGDIQCHYFCVLLSCCLVQKGRDTEGLFGFLYKDILAEVERSKKHKCSYCGRGGASLGCCVSACRKQFHLPCGRQKNVVSLFYGTYKSFCELHAPKQKISESVMANAKERMKRDKMIRAGRIPVGDSEDSTQTERPEMVCVICYEEVQGYPTTQTFWPPCCGRDAWLHRPCLQRMALSAGMHYLKCPLCNDKEAFYEAVSEQGYYLPDRDAAWELEQNAFAEIYSRELACAAPDCQCPLGRSHDEPGMWDIQLCLLCGSWGLHAHCACGERVLCDSCRPAAADLEQLESRLVQVIAEEQAREQQGGRSGPVMPSRMSLRRTKGRLQPHSSSSSSQNLPLQETVPRKTEPQSPLKPDRLSLSLKPPRRPALLPPPPPSPPHSLPSPLKLLDSCRDLRRDLLTGDVIDMINRRFTQPKPLSAKKKILNQILDDLFKNVCKENVKSKDAVKEWNSPKKSFDVTNTTCDETKENVEHITNTNTFETAPKDVSLEKDVELITNTNDSVAIESNKNEEEKDLDEIETNMKKETSEQGDNNHSDNLNVNEDNDNTVKTDDESSNSTFQLPPEFIAESDDSLPIFDTPKKLKTVDIKQDSSIEICEQEERVNVNVMQIGSGKEMEFIKSLTIKSPIKNKMCSFKFSPADKETLETVNVDIDVESFKDQYLNEVDRDFGHTYKNDVKIDSELDKGSRKRKLDVRDEVSKKRRKSKLKIKIRMNTERKEKKKGMKLKKKKDSVKDRIAKKVKMTKGEIEKKQENITKDLQKITVGELENAKNKRRARKLKKMKEKQKLKRKHAVKIKLKDESNRKIKTNISEKKEKSFKQYVLKYSPIQTDKVIAKPEVDVSPIKRKYIKQEKLFDKLVQTSIQSFFKTK